MSRNQILLWMDYEGEVFAKEAGTDHYLEIEGVTGRKGAFKSLCDDGERAYVMEYEAECIRSIDLDSQTSETVFSAEELRLGLCRNSSRGGSSVPLLDCLCQIPCTDHPGTALCDFPVEPAGDGRFSGILD